MEKICAICCAALTAEKAEKDFGHLFHSQKLSASLQKNFRKSGSPPVGGFSNKLSLLACATCVTCVTSAVGLKEKVVGAEEKVRHGQMLILKMKVKVVKMLEELQGAVRVFKEAVEGMEGVLEESRVNVGKLDEVYGDSDQGNELLKEAIQFRDKIMTMMQDLKQFKTQLGNESVRVSGVLGEPPSRTSRKTRAAESEPKSSPNPTPNAKISKSVGPENKAKVIPPLVSRMEDANTPSPPGSIAEAENDDNFCPDHDPADRDCSSGSEAQEESGGDGEDEYLPPKLAALKKQKMFKKRKALPVRQPVQNELQHGMDLKGMTKYKRLVIIKVLKLPKRIEFLRNKEKGDTSTFDAIDPLKTHPLTYDPALDKLVMGGIQLAINEEEKCLECTKCGKKMKRGFWKDVFGHVLGPSHLDVLQCPYCPSRLSQYEPFKQHVLGHAGKFTCDTCGKPSFKREDCLRYHKWTHMSQEEKDEAVRNGIRVPSSSYQKMKRKQGNLQCATCGKGGFLCLAYLRKHEAIHQEPKHICPKCGKKYQDRNHLLHHQRYVCISPEEKQKAYRFQCDLCLKKFPRKTPLRVHKLQSHSDLRPFKCSLCEKMFKTDTTRKTHEKTHGSERPHGCRKGCGAKYKNRNHCVRHEKTCKSVESN